MKQHDCIRPLAADVGRAATDLVDAFARVTQALYDLRESCRFYTDGQDGSHLSLPLLAPLTELGQASTGSGEGSGGDAERQLVHEGAERPKPPMMKEEPVGPIKALGDHLLKTSRFKNAPPSVEDAREVLNGFDAGIEVHINDYYAALRTHCLRNGLSELTSKGARYLAYCAGWRKCKIGNRVYLYHP